MRAAVITEPGGPDVLKIMKVDDPAPGPEDILVDVKATALQSEERSIERRWPPSRTLVDLGKTAGPSLNIAPILSN